MVRRREGFTLVEILIVIIIMGVLSGTALLIMGPARDKARYARFQKDKRNVENAAWMHFADTPHIQPELQDLIDKSYIDGHPLCIGEGNCTWSSADRKLIWLEDGVLVAEEPLSPLGSTFEEISMGMAERVLDYYIENGKPLSTWKDERYEDIGLDKAFWDNPVDGLLYRPIGEYVSVRPDDDSVAIRVTLATGEIRTLTSDLNWNIWHNVVTDTWYYHTAGDPLLIFDPETIVILR